MSYRMDRRAYAETFGPTVGVASVLLCKLFVEVEQDLTTYGDEVKFGGSKVIRDGWDNRLFLMLMVQLT